jgi:hypothetical protein
VGNSRTFLLKQETIYMSSITDETLFKVMDALSERKGLLKAQYAMNV